MSSAITRQILAAVAAAALVAGLVVFLAPDRPAEAATAPATTALAQRPAVVAATGTACSSRGWPAYEEKCQFDLRRPANEARVVRVIALR